MPEKALLGSEDPHRFDEELSRIPSQLVGHLLGTEDHHEIARIMMKYYREYRDLDDLNPHHVRSAFRLFRVGLWGDIPSLYRLADDVVRDGLWRWATKAEVFLGRYSILGLSSPFKGSFISEAVFAGVLYLGIEDHRQEPGLVDPNQTVVIGFCAKSTPAPVVGHLLTRMALRMVEMSHVRLLPQYLLFLAIVSRLANNPVRPEEIVLGLPAECVPDAIDGLECFASDVNEDPKVWQKHVECSEYVGDEFIVSEPIRNDFLQMCNTLLANLRQGGQGQSNRTSLVRP